jgi:hypothetical protein
MNKQDCGPERDVQIAHVVQSGPHGLHARHNCGRRECDDSKAEIVPSLQQQGPGSKCGAKSV